MDRSRTGDATDRERIAAALAELGDLGYRVPFAPWDVCCTSCGWEAVREQAGVDEDDGDGALWALGVRVAWWCEREDARAFAGDPSYMMHTDEFVDAMPEDEHELEQWFEDHQQEIQSDTMTARVTSFATLRAPLSIHWVGDAREIVAALRAQGLGAVAPDGPEDCIMILPDTGSVDVGASGGQVVVRQGGLAFMASPDEARELAAEILRAAEEAGR